MSLVGRVIRRSQERSFWEYSHGSRSTATANSLVPNSTSKRSDPYRPGTEKVTSFSGQTADTSFILSVFLSKRHDTHRLYDFHSPFCLISFTLLLPHHDKRPYFQATIFGGKSSSFASQPLSITPLGLLQRLGHRPQPPFRNTTSDTMSDWKKCEYNAIILVSATTRISSEPRATAAAAAGQRWKL